METAEVMRESQKLAATLVGLDMAIETVSSEVVGSEKMTNAVHANDGCPSAKSAR
jgi:hypothetical protein